MKKIIFLALLVYASTLNAQKFKFGVKGGLNLSSLQYDPEPPIDFKLKFGFHIGGVVQYKISEKFTVESQLLYSQQGVKTQVKNVMLYSPNPGDPFIGPPNGITVKAKSMLNYINIPILVRYYFVEKISVSLGPQLGYLISAKGKEVKEKYDIRKSFSDIDFGLNAGLGYEFTNDIFLHANYYYGLSNISDNNIVIVDQEIKQRVIQFSVGYLF